jgi:hypothetical protein
LRAYNNGAGDGVQSFASGTGRAGFFQIGTTSNPANSLEVITYGTGIAGKFNVINNSSNANALEASTNGAGNAGAFFGPVFVQSNNLTSGTYAFRTYNSIGSPLLLVENNGDVEVSGFTQLGTGAPAIKTLKLTATTSGTPGGLVNVPHGLNGAKILSVEVLVEYLPNNWVPAGYTINAGYEFNWYISGGDIVVWNKTGAASSNILSKPVKIFITYEQ